MAKNWLEKYNDGGPVQPNYNDAQASTGPGYVGTGYDTTGRNYSPAWGGQFQNGGFLQKAKSFPVIEDIEKINEHGLKVPDWEAMTKQAKQLGAKQVRTKHGATIIFDNNWEVTGATDPDPELAKLQMGGSMPGAVGFTYARTAGSAPDNGKYAKKTKASAQNGKEMQFYQNGLDWKPNNISRDGSVIKDDRGQWAHPGEITEIGSNNITMEGVDYPVLGVSDTGDTKLMQPGEDYKFKGTKVTEYPQAQNGWLGKYDNNQSDATRVAPKMIPLSKQQIQDNMEAARKMDLRNKVYEANPQTYDIGKYTPKAGDQERINAARDAYRIEEAKPLNRAASSKYAANAMENIVEPMMDIEAGLGAGQLLKSGIKSGVNTVGRGITNESSLSNVLSNTKDQLSNALKGTNSIFGQIKGELTQGAANRKSIQEGNEWLKNWIDNPTTQAKIDNSINNQINFRNNFYSDPSLDNIELIRNQSKNFTPNSKEYSLFKQADENLQQYLGAKNRQPIHTNNWGVSYAHGYSPEERQLIEEGQKKAHNYYGSWISRDPLLSQEKRIGTTVHEGTHDWVSEEAFKKSGMRNISLANTDPTIKNNFLKWEDLRKNGIDPAAIMGKDEAYQAYLADPTEMHARTMELRKHLGINPEDIANDDYSERVINYLKLLDNKNQPIDVNGYLNVINHKPNRLTNLLNNFWAVPPAVIATGAATSQQKKNGGWLNKYDNQGDATRVTPKVLPLSDKQKLQNIITRDSQSKRDAYYERVNKKPDSNLENLVEVVDPTGLSSWDDVYRSVRDYGLNSKEAGIDILGALPLVGKIGKIGKVASEVAKGLSLTARQARNIKTMATATDIAAKTLPTVGRATDVVQAYKEFKDGGWLNKYAEGGIINNDIINDNGIINNIDTHINTGGYTTPSEDINDINMKVRTLGVSSNTPTPNKQVQTNKELRFEDIPTKDKKKIIIDNFSPKFDYIVEGDKTYYKTKGGDTWADISNNKGARNNLLKFIDKNNYWAGYSSGEKEELHPIAQPTKSTPAPVSSSPTYKPSDILTTDLSFPGQKKPSEVTPVLAIQPVHKTIKEDPGFFTKMKDAVTSASNETGKTFDNFGKHVDDTVNDIKKSIESGANIAIQTAEDSYHTLVNGVKRKFATHTGNDDDAAISTTKTDIPKTVKEWYGNKTGPEISAVVDDPNHEGRQFKQQVLPTSNIKFGVRNRGEYKNIQTDGLEVTTFNPFTKDKLPDNTSVLALDPGGNLHTGVYKDFKNEKGFTFSKTFKNNIVDFSENNGKAEYIDGAKSGNPKYKQPKIKVLNDDGKLVDGSLNVLVKDDSKKNYYGSIQGGRVLFVNPTTKEQYLVSGSVDHIKEKFKELKGNNKYLEAYTLDNGTYSRGLSYKDKNLTPERLKSYDLENTGGGNGLYIMDYKQPVNKYKEEYIENMPNIRTVNDDTYKKGHALKNEVKNIVLHHTAYTNPNTSEEEVKKQYMTKDNNSSHVVIQENGKRTVYASPEQVTRHAGESEWKGRKNVNDFGVGVEFQGDTNKKPLTSQQIESFIEYYTPIAKKYNLALNDIITHQMVAPGRKPDIAEKEYSRILSYMKNKGYK